MSATRYMRQSLDFLHGAFRGADAGMSSAQAHFVPDGESHSVAWVMWHAARVATLTDEFLDGLDEAGLEREVQVGQSTVTVGQCITLHLVTYLNGHRGEVNLIRGMVGFGPVLPNQGG
jgi:hypothetical protein